MGSHDSFAEPMPQSTATKNRTANSADVGPGFRRKPILELILFPGHLNV